MEDLIDEIKDNEVEKNKIKDEKKIVKIRWAGGKLLRDKAAVQILSGGAVTIGGPEPSLLTARARESPTFSLSDMESSITPISGRKHSSGHNHFFPWSWSRFVGAWTQKIELEVFYFSQGCHGYEAERNRY
jgi:hypothetical protein